MAAHVLQLRRYAENKTTLLETIDLNNTGTITTWGYRLRSRQPSFHKWKDIWQNSPVLDGRRLIDFRQDVQTETIVIDVFGATTKYMQMGLSQLNAWMRIARDGQKRKNRGLPYIAVSLWANPLQGLAAASHTEVIAFDVDGIDNYFGPNIISNHAENITLTLTLSPYWTASEIDLVTDATLSNGASNYLQVTDDTTEYTVTNAVLTSNVATLTIGEHLLTVGDWFTAADISLDASFNGTYKISAISATASISYALTHANIGSAASTGTVTGQYVKGSRSAPTRHKVAGGSANTDKLIVGVRKQGNVANYTTHHLWAKDATVTVASASRTGDTTLDGNGTNEGTRTTAADTTEFRSHFWVVTSNPQDQYGTFNAFLRARSNTAGRYSARMRVGTVDGTNTSYPANGGYSKSAAELIGTDSGNALAWVDLGVITLPPITANGATVHGLLYELYLTCSATAGPATLDIDGIWMFPVGEGEEGTGYVSAKYPFGTAATGVGAGWISALDDEPDAYLASTADVITFPTPQTEGAGVLVEPAKEMRFYYALVDEVSASADNPRHDYTTALTVSVDYEVRYGLEGKTTG